MTRLRCSQVRDVAPELALGLLTGRERAEHLAHLEECGACRAEVSALAVTADDVLLTGPRSTPPPDFERRVLDRLAALRAWPPSPSPSQSPSPSPDPQSASASAAGPQPPVMPPEHGSGSGRSSAWGRGRRAVAAAVLVLAAVVAAVAGIAAVGPTGSPEAAATAEMRTGRGRLVGEATVEGDDPAVVTVVLPGWAELVEDYGDPGGTYWLAVELDDGSRTLGRMPARVSGWEVPLRAAAGDVAAVSVVDGEGRAWCTARFPA